MITKRNGCLNYKKRGDRNKGDPVWEAVLSPSSKDCLPLVPLRCTLSVWLWEFSIYGILSPRPGVKHVQATLQTSWTCSSDHSALSPQSFLDRSEAGKAQVSPEQSQSNSRRRLSMLACFVNLYIKSIYLEKCQRGQILEPLQSIPGGGGDTWGGFAVCSHPPLPHPVILYFLPAMNMNYSFKYTEITSKKKKRMESTARLNKNKKTF